MTQASDIALRVCARWGCSQRFAVKSKTTKPQEYCSVLCRQLSSLMRRAGLNLPAKHCPHVCGPSCQ